MDESVVRKIIEKNIKHLKRKLRLEDWDISVVYGDCSGDPAVTMCDTDYKIADIRFDPAYMDDKAEVLHVMLHELIHCHITMFGTYRQAVSCFLTEAERDAMNIIYRNAEERLACSFVRILERRKGDR